MIIINGIDQGSSDWLRMRLGVITASRASEFSSEAKLAPMPKNVKYEKISKNHHYYFNDNEYIGTNKTEVQNELRENLPPVYSDMRKGYMAELVAQIATGLIPAEMSFKQCEWGKEHEDQARAFFELELNVNIDVPTFIYRDKIKRFGLSPDGLITGTKTGLELKCPFTTKIHVEFVCSDKIKKEYIEQCQYSMWITGYESWYFASYDPRVKSKRLHYKLIKRDPYFMAKYDKAEVNFIKEMDSMIKQMGVEFGQQWIN